MEFDPREQKVQLIDSGGLTPGGLMDGKFSSECKCGEMPHEDEGVQLGGGAQGLLRRERQESRRVSTVKQGHGRGGPAV